MRIMQLKSSATRGGAETIVLKLTKALTARGHDVLTLIGERGWLTKTMQAAGLATDYMPVFTSGGMFHIPRLTRLCRDFRADVVLSHGARVNAIGSLAARLAHIPSVSIEHNIDDWRNTSFLFNSVDKITARLNSRRIAVSRAVADMLCDGRLLPASRVDVIPNGVDFPAEGGNPTDRASARQRFGLRDDDFVAVSVARLVPQKGHSYLIESIPSLVAEFPHLRFLFLGEGELQAALQSQVDRLGVAGKVVFAGSVDGVPDLLPHFDLFVLPSLWEGMPVALIEAMGAGLPVIATDVAGTPEVVADHGLGVLVPPGDSQAIGDAIRGLIINPEFREQIARSGCRHVRKHFSLESMVESYISVMQTTIEGQGTGNGEASAHRR